jgi:hypothetical protein
MNSVKYIIISILTFLLFTSACTQQTEHLKLDIYQNVLLATLKHGYEIENKTLRVYEESIYDNSGEYTEVERLGIYSKVLNEEEINSIIKKIKSLKIFELDSAYIEHALDGAYWNFDININENRKSIRLLNTHKKELSDLVIYINSFIPKDKQRVEIKNY